MTVSAALFFVVIVLAASLRAFSPRRSAVGRQREAGRRAGAGLVLGQPVPTLDLVGGERRSSPLRLGGARTAGPGSGPVGRFGD